MAMISCKEFIEFLDDYFAGTQSEKTRAEFDSHMAVCPDCVDYLKTYKESIRSTRNLCDTQNNQSVPPDAPEELIQAILAARHVKGDDNQQS